MASLLLLAALLTVLAAGALASRRTAWLPSGLAWMATTVRRRWPRLVAAVGRVGLDRSILFLAALALFDLLMVGFLLRWGAAPP